MLKKYRMLQQPSRRIAESIKDTVKAYKEHQFEHERDFTPWMLGAIRTQMNNFEDHGIQWRSRILTANVKDSEEKRYGADFVGVLDINLPDFKERKGFLAQAKRVGSGYSKEKLFDQCSKMLTISSESFVFLYSKTGVRVVTANSVLSSGGSTSNLYSDPASKFFREHLRSNIGDRNLPSATIEQLEELLRRSEARMLLQLEAHEKE